MLCFVWWTKTDPTHHCQSNFPNWRIAVPAKNSSASRVRPGGGGCKICSLFHRSPMMRPLTSIFCCLCLSLCSPFVVILSIFHCLIKSYTRINNDPFWFELRIGARNPPSPLQPNCETQQSIIQRLSSTIFPCCLYVLHR